MAEFIGMSCEELNIWIFVVIHPLVTLWLAVTLWRCRRVKFMSKRKLMVIGISILFSKKERFIDIE